MKAGFLGFAGGGKSWTAALLACHVRKIFKLKKPIAIYDTEAGAGYLNDLINGLTGTKPLVVQSRAFSDLVEFGEAALGQASVVMVDSITHPWRELCKSYLAQVNRARAARKPPLPPRKRLEFQDWAAIKDMWAAWPDFYLNAPLHINICGRAGFNWVFEEEEDALGHTHKELRKDGVKMKTEGEFGFEPSLLVEMTQVQKQKPDGSWAVTHRATVLKDRFGVMTGAQAVDPTPEFFGPHLQKLQPGGHTTIDMQKETNMGLDENGQREHDRERTRRTVLLEEIKGEFTSAIPGQGAADKKVKTDLLKECFGTRAWKKMELKSSSELADGLAVLRDVLAAKGAKK